MHCTSPFHSTSSYIMYYDYYIIIINNNDKLDDHLFKVLLDMSSIADKARLLSVSSPHAGSWLFGQKVLDSFLTLPNFRLLSSGGLDWTFPMVHAAHCALRLPWTHLAIMLLPAKGVVMWFPATTNCVMSLQSSAGELI